MKKKSYVILFDLDGTLADCTHRIHLVKSNDHPDWERFWDECSKDQPIAAGAVIYNLLCTQAMILGRQIKEGGIDADIPFVDIMTGRPEKLRGETIAWLTYSGLLMPRALHMRPDGDHRPDSVLKIELYERLYKDKETVLAVFEDRERCVKAWRTTGIPCFQVAEGAF